jgi:hypothetical protein
MILAASRAYFAPYPGYFFKAAHADLFVIMDCVQFPQGTTWLTRNRFKHDQGTLWMTVPVRKKGLGLQPIHDVRICREGRWRRKHLESLKHAYRHAPYFGEHGTALTEALCADGDRLIDLNLKLIGYLMGQLGAATPMVRLSELGIPFLPGAEAFQQVPEERLQTGMRQRLIRQHSGRVPPLHELADEVGVAADHVHRYRSGLLADELRAGLVIAHDDHQFVAI